MKSLTSELHSTLPICDGLTNEHCRDRLRRGRTGGCPHEHCRLEQATSCLLIFWPEASAALSWPVSAWASLRVWARRSSRISAPPSLLNLSPSRRALPLRVQELERARLQQPPLFLFSLLDPVCLLALLLRRRLQLRLLPWRRVRDVALGAVVAEAERTASRISASQCANEACHRARA